MIGKTISHYRITGKLGQGRRGEVYRTHDPHLARDVAVKVLPAETFQDESVRKRFRKEALALSKLNHPNIETVHDFDTQDGIDLLPGWRVVIVTFDLTAPRGAKETLQKPGNLQ